MQKPNLVLENFSYLLPSGKGFHPCCQIKYNNDITITITRLGEENGAPREPYFRLSENGTL